MTHDQIVAALQRGYQLDDAMTGPGQTRGEQATVAIVAPVDTPDAARLLIHARRTLTAPGRRAVSAQELLARLVDELPAPERVEPFAFLDDEHLPLTLTPVEPTAFVLACVQAAWGPHGPKNSSRATLKPATITPHPQVAP